MLYVLQDIDSQEVYGVFSSMEIAIRQKHNLAVLELNYYLKFDSELRQSILNASTEEEQKHYFDKTIEITKTSGYKEYLGMWKAALSVTEIEMNKLKVGDYLCK